MLAAGIIGQGTELVNPDFVALARSAGMFGVRVEDPADLKKAVTEAFQHDGPALIDAVVNRTELPQLRNPTSAGIWPGRSFYPFFGKIFPN